MDGVISCGIITVAGVKPAEDPEVGGGGGGGPTKTVCAVEWKGSGLQPLHQWQSGNAFNLFALAKARSYYTACWSSRRSYHPLGPDRSYLPVLANDGGISLEVKLFTDLIPFVRRKYEHESFVL